MRGMPISEIPAAFASASSMHQATSRDLSWDRSLPISTRTMGVNGASDFMAGPCSSELLSAALLVSQERTDTLVSPTLLFQRFELRPHVRRRSSCAECQRNFYLATGMIKIVMDPSFEGRELFRAGSTRAERDSDTEISADHISVRDRSRHHWLRSRFFPHDLFDRGTRDHSSSKPLNCRRFMGTFVFCLRSYC